MKKQQIAAHLRHSILFSDVSSADLDKYADVCRIKIVEEGEFVYQQGDASDLFFIVAHGEAELVIEREDGSSLVVGRIGQGGHFGETGILTMQPRSVNAKAVFDMVLICFEPRIFRSVLMANHLIQKRINAVLAERLRVAYQDQANIIQSSDFADRSSAEEVILFRQPAMSQIQLRRRAKENSRTISESKSARQAQRVIESFGAGDEPYLLTGEPGTGKQIIARQIHLESRRGHGPYVEFDFREHDPALLEKKLFGTRHRVSPFAQAHQASVFEEGCGGTIVLNHIRLMPPEIQRKVVKAIESNTFHHIDSDTPIALQARVVFISIFELRNLEESGYIIPELLQLFKAQSYHVPPLREHKRDLPRLIEHYLARFSREYGRSVLKVSPQTLGNLMNYDWPGNLNELSSVIRRAVMLAKTDEILSDHILLGLPKTEGKWEFNILRIPFFNRFLKSRKFPTIPRAIVGIIIAATMLALFLGPREPEKNIGLIMSWSIGWPLLFFSFFFLARTWCSVCTLAMPGKHLQDLIQPQRPTPQWIKEHSGWIMAVLCIAVMWVEIVWNAYSDPLLTGWIILAVTIGSSLASVFYARRMWCRYLCPLGAINAIFAMPAIIELRSNRHVCINRCTQHNCFGGGEVKGGCPMFRHPYLVDNNRDCIICGDCIKNCNNSSIHLNLRLAPQELWSLETPRRADSFLIVALGAIFFPFALQEEFHWLSSLVVERIAALNIPFPVWLAGSLLFMLCILIFQAGYYLMVQVQSWYAGMERSFLLSMLGYGFIPLMLGGYMAVYFEHFVREALGIIPAIQGMLGNPVTFAGGRLLSPDSTYVLQIFTILGGLLAAMYATYRIVGRVQGGSELGPRSLMIPWSFLLAMGGLFISIV